MTETLRSTSPADRDDEIGRFAIADAAAIDGAIARARSAYPKWRESAFVERVAVLRRFQRICAGRAEELAPLIAREVGKALWDAEGEAGLLAPKVDAILSAGLRFVAPIEAGAGARADYQPRGVLAILGPFNFPTHLPNGHIVPALVTGNTLVFKPSEHAPACGQWLVDRWREAGLPEGVLEIVHGGAATGEALALHPDVDGVIFTGSWQVGRRLHEATLDQPEKILALEMGGKNAVVVLADTDLDLAVTETALSICATTGQRCSSASRIFVERSVFEPFAEALAEVLRAVRIGAPLAKGVFMGPLVSEAAFEKLMGFRALAGPAGGTRTLAVDPGLAPPFVGPGLVRFESTAQSHPYQREEIFGPEAALYPIDDLDHAIEAVNDSDYGLVASLFSTDRRHFEHAIGRIETGLLNWNRGTIGASGQLPFVGRKRSGNHRPAGILAGLYCTQTQSRLENPNGFDPRTVPPGFPKP